MIERFQQAMVGLCGAGFVRLMSDDTRTNTDVAKVMQESKHAPEMPQVTAATGFAPTPDSWLEWLPKIQGWVNPSDAELGKCVQQVIDDHVVHTTSYPIKKVQKSPV